MPREKAPPPRPSRKHLALAQRERRMSRIMVLGVGLVLASVVLLVGAGIAQEKYFKPRRPAVTVNGEAITRDELGARTSLAQADLLQQRQSAESMLSFFADSPEAQQSLQQQIAQINAQINDPGLLAGQVMQTLIQARLVRQEAERLGITVTEEELDRAVMAAYGFFPGGTPTPLPTATIDATRLAQSTPTSRPSPSPTTLVTATTVPPTATTGPSSTPLPTPTAYSREAFEANYQSTLSDLKANLGVGESTFRDRFAETLYHERLLANFQAEVPRSEEQVWAKHILVPSEATAKALQSRLRQGEDWDALAASYSLDTSNKDIGGDLGWFGRRVMIDAFEQAAFDGQVGQIVGPVQTAFGWHLITILDRRERNLDQAGIEAAAQRAYSDWLANAIQTAELVYDPELVPPTATPDLTLVPQDEERAPTATPAPPTVTS